MMVANNSLAVVEIDKDWYSDSDLQLFFNTYLTQLNGQNVVEVYGYNDGTTESPRYQFNELKYSRGTVLKPTLTSNGSWEWGNMSLPLFTVTMTHNHPLWKTPSFFGWNRFQVPTMYCQLIKFHLRAIQSCLGAVSKLWGLWGTIPNGSISGND